MSRSENSSASRGSDGRFIKGHTMHLKHGLAHTSTHQAWNHARQRCTNPNDASYRIYGARGIIVCDRWQLFDNFLADMGPAPAGMTLERKDNDGDYEPGNCVWAPRQAQNRNKRYPWNKITLADAKAIKASAEQGTVLAVRYGVSRSTISAIRHERNWKDA